jgi:CubicO group peptidase (beta-lactamase class C family)
VRGTVDIEGDCDTRFAPVRRAFADNFSERDELGAALFISLGGEPVVDVWAGWTDVARTRRWQRETLVDVFSVGKAAVTVCALALVDRGLLDLDQPVATWWPEFAASRKEGVTVRALLAHRAGLPAIREPLPADALYDWAAMTKALAREAPWWEPGTTHGYHVNTFGFLVGELVRRVSGVRIGTFLQSEICGPIGADFRIGIGRADQARTAQYLFGTSTDQAAFASEEEAACMPSGERRLLLERAYFNPPGVSGLGTVNSRAWREAEIPSANGHATARGVARLCEALLEGELLSTRILDEATREASSGADFVLARPSRFGLGFQLTQPERTLGPNPRAFGHFGAGGSLGFADPDAGIAFGYVMNRSGPRWQNPRNRALIDAAYEVVARL